MTGDSSCSNCPDDKRSCVNNLCSNGEANTPFELNEFTFMHVNHMYTTYFVFMDIISTLVENSDDDH